MWPSKEDHVLAEKYGWVIECESPFEMSHSDGSFARGQAASYVILGIREEEKDEREEEAQAEQRKIHYINVADLPSHEATRLIQKIRDDLQNKKLLVEREIMHQPV